MLLNNGSPALLNRSQFQVCFLILHHDVLNLTPHIDFDLLVARAGYPVANPRVSNQQQQPQQARA